MVRLYIFQTGQTAWETQDRIEPPTGVPLTEEGALAVQDAAKELADHPISAVYACTTGEAERQTAEQLAKTLGVKLHVRESLHDLDYGLWRGLTADELKRRQPKAYRQWIKAPTSVRPPEGETPDEAQQRLREALKKILKRHRRGSAALVLRPLAVGLLRCMMENQGLGALWQHVDTSFRWSSYEVDQESL